MGGYRLQILCFGFAEALHHKIPREDHEGQDYVKVRAENVGVFCGAHGKTHVAQREDHQSMDQNKVDGEHEAEKLYGIIALFFHGTHSLSVVMASFYSILLILSTFD